ncbi:phosphoethanolamine--lipid A transferase EptA [Zobellia barbeyronii]|uniref:Phosphoethanolamine--lipid A transferase EptA n=1 Tax=Zobellia barbeyronii TaxID=2748009 RepID=A0ABS5WGH3_9FLAO|nr:phosphoethanolamine--lipid A transferase EptA [Zobellia barbeyronii]MBT2161287.1 phosphoethanolamine--lipid A transferase EptA [Zobellia barbeyronii]
MFKKKIETPFYALIASFINVVLYNIPLFKLGYNNIELSTFNGVLLITSLVITAIVSNFFIFYIAVYLLRHVGKWLLILFFIINSLCVYFIVNYGVLIDRSMIGNILNTNYDEASSFISFTLLSYLIFLGVLPSLFIYRLKYERVKLKPFLLHCSLALIFLLSITYVNAPNWLWVDKNSKTLGSLVMPWSYVANTIRFYHKENKQNQKQTLLPDAKITNDRKSIVVLVIGESARSANYSLYGYDRNTNPLLAKIKDLHVYEAQSSATYTTAGVKAILDYKESNDLNEILPNYLNRNDVEVIWRTTNWGEPKVNIKNYQDQNYLRELCEGTECDYDDVLLYQLKDLIVKSKKNKILIVLHTSTSHGPTYYKKYPPEFEQFTPVCKSVELSNCTNQELVNAYDNTILYTDYLLAKVIENLKQLNEYNSGMIYVSDHGESLGEKNLYMHGIPLSIAPKEQFEIPFIVWTTDKSLQFKNKKTLSQYNVFHSILDFLEVESPIYDKDMSILKK